MAVAEETRAVAAKERERLSLAVRTVSSRAERTVIELFYEEGLDVAILLEVSRLE